MYVLAALSRVGVLLTILENQSIDRIFSCHRSILFKFVPLACATEQHSNHFLHFSVITDERVNVSLQDSNYANHFKAMLKTILKTRLST